MNAGAEARLLIRSGGWRRPTAGLAPGHVQANLAILPQADALDFARFCFRNPRPCPVLDVTEPGSPHPSAALAAGADLRTDLPRYRVYRGGELAAELDDLNALWQDDFVAFLLGCSFTFEQALIEGGIPVRHVECGCNVPMFRTNRACQPAGPFAGPLVVSMRPIPAALVPRAVTITARYPQVHGAPVHIGDPAALGIADVLRPDYGDAVPVQPGEVPVFWACGVTPQAVAQSARLPLMITHAPGHMLICDTLNRDLEG
ncbi:MAG TPA: putative hydro-lyase [Anaerolineaceae bacterium]|nr:putative hydro-lyase [Anaerolineaceae bacterium]HPN51226.1 putative hydro-lyase [Anaerolineaceae bacterium]